MSTQPLLVSLAYLVPLALIAVALTGGIGRPRRLMPALLLALPLFYIGHYLLLERIEGWPSDAPLPDEFRLEAYRITEPDPRRGEPGRILLWVTAPGAVQPRVHRLAYRKDLHKELVAAGQRQADGRPQVGRRHTPAEATPSSAGDRLAREVIRFDNEQPPRLPAKSPAD